MSRKQWASLGTIVWEKYFFWVYVEYKFLKSLTCHVLVMSLRAWQTKFKVLEDLIICSVSEFSFGAIEPIGKAGNDGNCQFGWI